MTVLVTGANGFVGSALCELMRENHISVRAVFRAPQASLSDASGLAIGDINSSTDWTPVLESVEQVIHLAARVNMVGSNSSDLLCEFRRVNVEGTANLARQAAAAGVRRFIFLSSIKVNGESTEPGLPLRSDSVPAPEDSYGRSKYEAEQMLWRVAAETGMEVVVLRPPLVYGPGVKGNFRTLMQAIYKRRPLPFGSVQNRRSMIYIGNLVDAILLCLSHPNAAGKTFLLSDGEDVSTCELVRRIASAFGHQPFLLPIPVSWLRWIGCLLGKKATIDRLFGSLTLDTRPIERDLGWQRPYKMQQGLQETVEWYCRLKDMS